MKNSRYILLMCVIAFSMSIQSCDTDDFLTRAPKGSLDEGVVSDPAGVNTLLMGAYAALSQTGTGNWGDGLHGGGAWEVCPSNWIYGSVMGMDAHKGTEPGDQAPINTLGSFNHTPTHGFINAKWVALYEGITRANSVLRVLPDVDVVEGTFTEQDKLRIEAEARFIRGHFYFELTRFFDRVPWIDEETDPLTPQPNVNNWERVEEDFQFAYDNLPSTQAQPGRPNNWAAASYLAKTYMYQDKFQQAKALYDQIIPNGQTSSGDSYDLVPLDMIHNPVHKNHAESIFAIQASADDGTGGIQNANPGMMLNYPFSDEFRCCGFYQPTQFLVNAYQTENGLPLVDDHLATEVTWDQGLTSSEQFDPHVGPLDPRLDWTVGRRGVPFHDWRPHPGRMWVRDQPYAGPYHAKKHIWWRKDDEVVNNPQMWAPGSSYNIPIIRFADVLLMAAEAEIEVGSIDQARQYINRVRERAADSDHWVNNDFNREYARAVVDNEAAMLNLDPSPSSGQWVVRDDLGTTFVYLGGGAGDIGNWNEYPDPADNYEIATYADLGSQANARDIVRFERKLELALEGHRFFDLVRWGIAKDELDRAMDYETQYFTGSYMTDGRFSENKNEVFPIPQNQIDLSEIDGVSTLEQNTGY